MYVCMYQAYLMSYTEKNKLLSVLTQCLAPFMSITRPQLFLGNKKSRI